MMHAAEVPAEPAVPAVPAVSVHKLHKEYPAQLGGKRVVAVHEVSLSVRAGEVFGFLGPNGAGKTTTLKVLMGLMRPSSGKVQLFGMPSEDPKARVRVGFLPESPYVYAHLTAREYVRFAATLSGMPKSGLEAAVEAALLRVGLGPAAIDRPARTLSKGMLQRTGIAAALVHDPDLLVLDEPMSGLDPIGRREVRDLILAEKARGKAVLFSTHVLSDAESLCDRLCVLHQGRVVLEGEVASFGGQLEQRFMQETGVVSLSQ